VLENAIVRKKSTFLVAPLEFWVNTGPDATAFAKMLPMSEMTQPQTPSTSIDGSEPELSVIVPVFNEAENLELLCREVHSSLGEAKIDFELIFADDGSTDDTPRVLDRMANEFPRVRVVTLRRNSGQTAALSAALDQARGRILIPMDGDLQNDPADIPRLLEKLKEGYDVVSGWRRNRKDAFVSRRVPSRIANRLVAWLSGMPLHDFGCTLKAYRRGVLDGVRLYGEMHRFVPIYAAWQGARVTEIEVNHRPRQRGRSKYGIGRTFRVLLDLMLIRFLDRYAQRPMHLFGGFGLICLFLAMLGFCLVAFFKIVKLIGTPTFSEPFVANFGKDFVENPLTLLVALFGVTGILSILMGLLAEMVMRTYFESQKKRIYQVKGPAKSEGRDKRGSERE
jgi:glycosyltransferase involved in cell wall biosynthesis